MVEAGNVFKLLWILDTLQEESYVALLRPDAVQEFMSNDIDILQMPQYLAQRLRDRFDNIGYLQYFRQYLDRAVKQLNGRKTEEGVVNIWGPKRPNWRQAVNLPFLRYAFQLTTEDIERQKQADASYKSNPTGKLRFQHQKKQSSSLLLELLQELLAQVMVSLQLQELHY